MIGTFNNALSTLEIWFFDESRMILVYTSLTHNGKDLLLCRRLQALDLINYSTRMARRFQILGILNIYAGFILDQLGTSSIWCLEIDTSSTTLPTGLRPVLRASLLKGLSSLIFQ
jgi:hypothetical protein